MTRQKKQQASKLKNRVPEFTSREDEARWFDTHDMADYQDEFKTVRTRFAKNLSNGITIRLDTKTLTRLRTQAHEKGLGPTTLVRMWILERLKEQESRHNTQPT